MRFHKLHDLGRALVHFTPADSLLPAGDDMDELICRRGRGTMLLGFYTPDEVLEAIDRYGAGPKLRSRGFSGIEVELQTAEEHRQVVRVTGRKLERPHLLGEVILRADSFVSRADFAGPLRDRPVRMLYLQWLRLQDPTRSFDASRPPLPGQEHPGLGVGREVMSMFLGLADRLGFSGIMVCPEFAHNAVLYSGQFSFFDPAAQGRFVALSRCLDHVTLAELSWAVQAGCVTDRISGRPFAWFHEEMLRATSGVIVDHVRSENYARLVSKNSGNHAYDVDLERLWALDLPPRLPLD